MGHSINGVTQHDTKRQRDETLKQVKTVSVHVFDESGLKPKTTTVPLYVSTLKDLSFVIKVPEHLMVMLDVAPEVRATSAEQCRNAYEKLHREWHAKAKLGAAQPVIAIDVSTTKEWHDHSTTHGFAKVELRWRRCFKVGDDLHTADEFDEECGEDDSGKYRTGWASQGEEVKHFRRAWRPGYKDDFIPGVPIPYTVELDEALGRISGVLARVGAELEDMVKTKDLARIIGPAVLQLAHEPKESRMERVKVVEQEELPLPTQRVRVIEDEVQELLDPSLNGTEDVRLRVPKTLAASMDKLARVSESGVRKVTGLDTFDIDLAAFVPEFLTPWYNSISDGCPKRPGVYKTSNNPNVVDVNEAKFNPGKYRRFFGGHQWGPECIDAQSAGRLETSSMIQHAIMWRGLTKEL